MGGLKASVPMDQELEQIGAKLDAILALLEQPAVPLADQLWDNADIGSYLRRTPKVVRETLTPHPSFPKAIRLPGKGKARPLYKAKRSDYLGNVAEGAMFIEILSGHRKRPASVLVLRWTMFGSGRLCLHDQLYSSSLLASAQLSSAWPDEEKGGLAALVLRHF